jgi:hypothetical protein
MANPVLCSEKGILDKSLFLYSLISSEGKEADFIEQSYFKNPVVAQLFKKPRILWNPKTNCGIDKSRPLVPILSQMNPVNTLKYHSLKFHFNVTLQSAAW